LIGSPGNWDDRRWPLKPFGRRAAANEQAWSVEYGDDLQTVVRKMRITTEEYESLPMDGGFGSGALESTLSQKLSL
jgi:hypothetical protein